MRQSSVPPSPNAPASLQKLTKLGFQAMPRTKPWTRLTTERSSISSKTNRHQLTEMKSTQLSSKQTLLINARWKKGYDLKRKLKVCRVVTGIKLKTEVSDLTSKTSLGTTKNTSIVECRDREKNGQRTWTLDEEAHSTSSTKRKRKVPRLKESSSVSTKKSKPGVSMICCKAS